MGGPVRFQKQHRHIQNLEDDHKTIHRLNKGRPLKYIQLHLSKKSDKKTLKIFKGRIYSDVNLRQRIVQSGTEWMEVTIRHNRV